MMQNTDRYNRQICLPEIGQEGQERLLRASVLCVGAGGLGSSALLYLAAAGVGRIGIIDFDWVDESNLQRQVIFSTEAVGRSKAAEATQRLRTLNPHIQVVCHDEELNAESAARLFPAYDLVLDGTDNFETKFLINDAAVKFGKPWVYGAIQGFDGQASVFNYQDGPCYRCLQPEKPKGHVMNCAAAGVIGAVAGIIGVTQALQAIQMITGHRDFVPLAGKIWLLDTRTMQTRLLHLKKNSACPACGSGKNDIVLRYASALCAAITDISAQQLNEKEGHILIDVREDAEWQAGHIKGAVLWPLSRMVAGQVPVLQKDSDIILYCQRGARSLHAAMILRDEGFTRLGTLSCGYEGWPESL